MAATIKDIRARTGLSLATISKYLNGGNVLPENRQKIEEAIAELHYEVNEIARGLVTSRTRTVGVVVYSVESLFTGALIRHIGEALRREGYGLLICDSDEDPDLEAENISFLLAKKVDGMILLPVGRKCKAEKALKSAKIPVVVVDRALPGGFDCVRVNNREAARRAVGVLTHKSHRKIAVISSDESTYTGWERFLGYEEALAEARCPLAEEYQFCGEHSIEFGHASMEKILAMDADVRPTAVFTTNYEITLGAVMALNESDKSCPEDISIIGFDNLLMNHVVKPKMYLVAQPIAEMGEEAARLILKRVRSVASSGSGGSGSGGSRSGFFGASGDAPIEIVFGATIQEGNSIKELPAEE